MLYALIGNEITIGFRFDFSEVNETREYNGKTTKHTKYELEIEKFNTSDDLGKVIYNFRSSLSLILTLLCTFDGNLRSPSQIISQKEKLYITSEHNSLFEGEIVQRKLTLNENMLYKEYQNKPVSLKLPTVIDPLFRKKVTFDNQIYNFPAITVKYDGTRKLLMILDTGCYMIFPPYYIIKVAEPVSVESLLYTIIDGEFMENGYDQAIPTFYSFDLLFHNHIDYRQSHFLDRLKILSSIQKVLNEHFKTYGFNISYQQKEYYMSNDFYENVSRALIAGNKHPEHTDGIIFQPSIYYRNKHTKKWKPSEKLTIDFRVMRKSDNEYVLMTYGYDNRAKRNTLQKFTGSYKFPYKGELKLNSIFEDADINNKIIEFKWDYENGEFIPYRYRNDRENPNNTMVAKEIWDEIREPISSDTLEGKNLILLRKFHNEIKKDMLLRSFHKGDIILDIGSGRGGDLHKWKELGLSKVYVVEPNLENIEILKERRNQIYGDDVTAPLIVIINDKIENTASIIASISKKDTLAGVVAFFSLTFVMETSETFESFIDTITSVIPENGKFIGIVMEGREVEKHLGSDGIRNEAFSIISKTDIGKEKFGNEINIEINDETSMVKNQTEWLFYFQLLQSSLRGYGFITESHNILDNRTPTRSLNEAFELLPKDARLFSSLNQAFFMKRFEKKSPESRKDEEKKIQPLTEEGSKERYIFATSEQPQDLYERIFVQPSKYNIFIAFLRAITKRIDSVTGKQQKEFAKQIFAGLKNNKFTKDMYKEFPESLKKKLKYSDIENFLNGEGLEDSSYILVILAKIFKVSVLLFSDQGSAISSTSDMICKSNISDSPRKAVLMVKFITSDGNDHFELIRVNGESLIKISDYPFIQHAIEDLCKK